MVSLAAQCQIIEVNNNESKIFYNENHIQGGIFSSKNFALKHHNQIVAVMSFSKPRFNKEYDWELTRFATKLDCRVYGAGKKLFNYFLTTINHNSKIVSYCNLSYFVGNLYQQLGFMYKYTTPPNYFYVLGLNKITRYNAQKHKLANFLEIFDSAKTEAENMFVNKYRRYWDCGNDVWEFIYQGEK